MPQRPTQQQGFLGIGGLRGHVNPFEIGRFGTLSEQSLTGALYGVFNLLFDRGLVGSTNDYRATWSSNGRLFMRNFF